jgi:hypothetical protein
MASAVIDRYGTKLDPYTLAVRKQQLLASVIKDIGAPSRPPDPINNAPPGTFSEYYHFRNSQLKIMYPPPRFRSRHPELKPIFSDSSHNDKKLSRVPKGRTPPRHNPPSAEELKSAKTHILQGPLTIRRLRHNVEPPLIVTSRCIQL